MEQSTTEKEWLSIVPEEMQPHMSTIKGLASAALENGSPYHSIRVAKHVTTTAGEYAGRILGWAISATTDEGWEYVSATLEEGHWWLLFKNPYVFS